MKTKLLHSLPDSINARLFFVLVTLYQIIFTFQGLDFADEGFNATFYQQIFSTPDSVEYNFMFWLCGVIGGAFYNLFPEMGLWGLRFLGVIVTTLTIIFSYRLLKPYLREKYLQLGLFIALIVISNNIKIFHYNYLSPLLYVITASFIFSGLRKDSLWRLFLGGAFVGLDTFARLPSILNFGLILAIFYYGYLQKVNLKRQLIQSFTFFAGFIFTIVSVILTMKLTNQFDHFWASIQLLSKMGQGGKESHYGLLKLIKQFFDNYGLAIGYSIFIIISVVILALFFNYLKTKSVYRKWFFVLLKYLALAFFLLLLPTGILTHYRIVLFLSGFSIIAASLVLGTSKDNELRLLAFMSIFILLAYPFGSSDSLFTVGFYSLWLILPIATNYIFSLRHVTNAINFTETKGSYNVNILVTHSLLKETRKAGLIITITACLYYAYYYPFFDYHNRADMRYSVNDTSLRNIYTTKERAQISDSLFKHAANYVKEGDYVFGYHSIPLFHFATNTKPYLKNPMPWLYDDDTFKKLLSTARTTGDGKLPVVVSQLARLSLESSYWPTPIVKDDPDWIERNKNRDFYFEEFLRTNNYKEVWRNELFRILIPPLQ
jgi:hypothetical protein